ncbi:MAG: DUF2339 domain-containing protein [Hyphomicrobium sp.]|nr:DUF2339 domain-containing protein [Hyphomicrobium sp.]
MDFAIILLAGLIWIYVQFGKRLKKLEERLTANEAQIAALRAGTGPQAGEVTAPEAPTPIALPPPVETSVPPIAEGAPEEPEVADAEPPALPADAAPAKPPRSLEERLGTRWAVWVGGLALALGGILMVRYSIEQGIFGPGARVFLGALLALVLVGAGEWLRRSSRGIVVPGLEAAHIPSILTAAGTVTAFGTVYAAHALYGFIGPALAFVLLGAIGVATMFAAALHGPMLAGLGLAGAYAGPLLVTSDKPSPWPVVLYLAVVAASAHGLARLRHWLWLAAFAVGGAFLWGLPYIDQAAAGSYEWARAGYAHVLLQLALAAVFMALEPHVGVKDEEAQVDQVAAAALLAMAVLAVAMLADSRFEAVGWVPFAAAAAGLLAVTAWLSPPAAAGAAFAGLPIIAVAAFWPGLKDVPDASLLAPFAAQVLRLPENVSAYLTTLALLGAGTSAVAGYRMWRGPTLSAPVTGFYALGATVPLLLALVLAYLRVTQFDSSIPFALFGVILAGGFVWVAERFLARELIVPLPGIRLATGAFAAAAIAALSFALVAFLSRGYMTVAFALMALGTSYVATLRDIPLLRPAVAAIGLIVLGRIMWDPAIMGTDVGRIPILNWLLIGYGVPAVAFAIAGRLLELRATDLAQRLADALAVVFTALLLFFQIRHALNAGDPLSPLSSHIEQGLQVLMAILLAYVLMRLDLARSNVVFRWASIAFGVIAILFGAFGLLLFENPLISTGNANAVVGPVIFSSLLLAYFVPGIAAAFLARNARGVRPNWYVTMLYVLAGVLVFFYVTLEIRHAFQGPRIGLFRSTGGAEHWAYSAGWLLLGIVYLAYGIWRGAGVARLASAILVLLAVIKVFLFDLAGLTGLWRALSFITLGAVLIGIGLAYQKLVFARPPAQPNAPPDEGATVSGS